MTDPHSPSRSEGGGGITLRIHHRVRPGARDRYEAWLHRIIAVAARYAGHQGVHILRPHAGGQDYEIAVRFASEAQAERWRSSRDRRELLDDIRDALQQDEAVEILSGIDYWFSPPTATSKQPVRWKQWLVTTAVIWPLTMLVPLLWQPVFSVFPLLDTWGLRHGLVVATVVALVVYVVMPRGVRLVAHWMFE